MYILEVEAERYRTVKFEVPSSRDVGLLVQFIFKRGVSIEKVTVTYRDDIPVCDPTGEGLYKEGDANV
mgnify:CR=1 FL=1